MRRQHESTPELRDRREGLGLTLLDLARRAGCPVETVLHAECGLHFPRGRDLRSRLAEAYRLSRTEFLDGLRRALSRRARG